MIKSQPRTRRSAAPRHAILGLLVLALVGAAVWISYAANAGLPLQGHFRLYVAVPDASRLVHYDEVRIAGIRVGEVERVGVIPGVAGAPPYADLELALDPSVRIPTDTRAQIRSASLLGNTYVALLPGHSHRLIASGGALPLTRAVASTQLTDLLGVFNRSTARNMQDTIAGLGYGLAGRGADLNDTIAAFATMLGPLRRVMQTLASPAADLPRFLTAYEATIDALARSSIGDLPPVGAATFAALNAAGRDLGTTIDAWGPSEAVTGTALQALEPGLVRTAVLMRTLRPGTRLLAPALADTNGILGSAIPAFARVPELASPLRTTLRTLTVVVRRPSTDGAVRKLTDTVLAVTTVLAKLLPAQVQCNELGLFGSQWELMLNTGVRGGGFLQDLDATSGAAQEAGQHAAPSPNMHENPDPVEDYQRCESGNEPYIPNVTSLGNPSGPVSNRVPSTSPPADAMRHTPPGTP